MNSYEEFLQSIDELYDQNKLDFNNYKFYNRDLTEDEINQIFTYLNREGLPYE